jgi:putative ABC transport system ATP-binding protein
MGKDATPILEMRGISRVYRAGLVETHALRGFDLRIDEGEFVAITGPSGSGKTTFLSIAGMLENPTRGEYFLDGQEIGRLSDRARSSLRNRKIGFVFQGFNLIPDLDVFNNVELPLRYRGMGRSERLRRAHDALAQVGLASRLHHFPSQLSGGQQQRVAIARALAGQPRVLLADEPTGNLDSAMTEGVLGLLEQLHAQGSTIVLVTHDAALAACAQRRVHMVDGVSIASPA